MMMAFILLVHWPTTVDTAPAAGLACLCCLGELEDTGSVTAGRGMAATAYVGLSLVWIGLGWTEQGRAGTSSGQKLNLST